MKPKPSCRLEPTACTAIGWKMRLVQMTEDTAGNRWFLEFDAGSTAPVRRWVERPQRVYIYPLGKSDQSSYISLIINGNLSIPVIINAQVLEMTGGHK